ncbi:MAG: glycosyltransferase [Alcanivoracaceae bacterium]|nr:glycosyltransferase [Alcanivoracaceae bacterium]
MPSTSAPMLTVIIPTRNRIDFVEQAIQSIRTQCATNWRIILVDDGSDTPVSEQLSADILANIQILRNDTSCGVSCARNQGAEAADSEWILFLDDDDWLDHSFIRAASDAVTIYGPSMDFMWPQRSNYYMSKREIVPATVRDVQIKKGQGTEEAFAHAIDVSCTGMLFKRASFLQAGGFDPTLRVSEDRDLVFRLLSQGYSCRSLAEPRLIFRIHDGERLSTHQSRETQANSDMLVIARFDLFFRQHPMLANRFIGRVGKRLWREGYATDAIKLMKLQLEIEPSDLKSRKRLWIWMFLSLFKTKLYEARNIAEDTNI